MGATSANKKRQIIATLAVLMVIVVIVAGRALSQQDSGDDASMSDSTPNDSMMTTSRPAPTTDTANSKVYKDGTYEAVGGYNSPGGAEEITVSVTLQADKITASTVKKGATGGNAEFHQEDFIAAFKELVVGKNIEDLKLNRVAGASLTTGGFNNAIIQIKNAAVQS